MREYKALLSSFVEVVTFLLAAFGGFLKNVAPPAAVGASYPVGILSFLVLFVLLVISALARKRQSAKSKRVWLSAGLALSICAAVSGILYPHVLGRYTFPENADIQNRKICAPDDFLKPKARSYKQAHPEATAEELESNFDDNDIWTIEGLEKAQSVLLITYSVLVLSIAGAVFCLLEANMGIDASKKTIHSQE